jgi:hypothetical protein
MQIRMHAKDLASIASHDAELVEGFLAALVLIAFLGLALGAVAVDVARLIGGLLALMS